MKYCTTTENNNNSTYKINISKSNGIFKGKILKKPYHADDEFHYLIVEIGGKKDNLEKYHNYFCVIPKSVLIERKHLTVGNKMGKMSVMICPPDYPKDHWSKQYWIAPNQKIVV
jgi:hypothetical protein